MFRSTRNAWLAGLVISLLAGYFLAGHYLYKAPIGLDSFRGRKVLLIEFASW